MDGEVKTLDPEKWEPVENPQPIIAGRFSPPPPFGTMNPLLRATIPQYAQLDSDFSAQRYKPTIPTIRLFPIAPSGRAEVNASGATQATVQVKPVSALATTANSNAATAKTTANSANSTATSAKLLAVAASSARPETNPLTAHDNGTNATITVANFNMNINGLGPLAITGNGGVTGFTYGTVYYVYYADPNLAGGAVTLQYTTTKANVTGSTANFYVGSILTPVSGGADTTGNNDGGAGAQTGFSFNIFESAYASTATSGGGLSLSNPGNMVDGNINDDGTMTVSSAGSGYVIFSGMQLGQPAVTSLTLNVKTQIATNNGATMALAYSLNGGSTWTNIYSVITTRALTTDSVTLSITQPLSNVLVRFTGTYNAGTAGICSFYGAWVTAAN